MATGSALRGGEAREFDFVSPQQLFAHFSALQAQGLTAPHGNPLVDYAIVAGPIGR